MTALPEPGAASESDAALLERVRNGDRQAYGVLWDRHHRAGLSAARAITSTFDAEDLVSEAFVRVLKAIEHGSGPTAAFRPYLVATVRSVAARWGSRPAELTPEDLEIVDPASSDEAFSDRFDQSLTVQAFNTLPKRWQEVLWYTEAEQLPPREAAALIGIKPNVVSALAKRAREGLRHAWVQAHIATVPEDSECRWAIDRLAMSTRKSLPAREQDRLDAHLEECDRCPLAAEEITAASRRLGALILIGFLGAGAATAYGALLKPAAATAATLGAGAVAGKAGGIGGAAAGKAALVRNVSIGAGGTVAAAAAAVGIAFAAGVLGPQHQPPPVKPAAVAAAPGGASGSSSSSSTSDASSPGSAPSTPSSPAPSAPPVGPHLPPSPLTSPSTPVAPVAPAAPAASASPSAPPATTQSVPVAVSAVDTGKGLYYPVINGTGDPGATVTVTQASAAATSSLRLGRMGEWGTTVLRTAVARPAATVFAPATTVARSSATTVAANGNFTLGPLSWVQPDADGNVQLLFTQRNLDGQTTTTSVTARMPRQILGLSAPLGSGNSQLMIAGAKGATVLVRFSDGTEKQVALDASGHGMAGVPSGASSATVGYVDPKSDRVGPTQAVQLASLPVSGSGSDPGNGDGGDPGNSDPGDGNGNGGTPPGGDPGNGNGGDPGNGNGGDPGHDAPAPPVQGVSVDAGVGDELFPIISGTGFHGDTVYAEFGGQVLGTPVIVGDDNTFTLPALTDLLAGTTTVTLYQDSSDGQHRSTGVDVPVTLTAPPALAVLVAPNDPFGITTTVHVTLSKGIPNGLVHVDTYTGLFAGIIPAADSRDIQLDANGATSFDIPGGLLNAGASARAYYYADGADGRRSGLAISRTSDSSVTALSRTPSAPAQIALDLEQLLGFAWREV
ncbi:MAG TPA: sigma-70 family RNA polymerase sigma factor [Gryllotalpicola sp.]